jgi:hypothetical protein
MADNISTTPINSHTVFATMLVCGTEIVVYRVKQGKWFTFSGDFKTLEALVLTFMFLAILSGFAPQLAGALALAVTVVLSLKLIPEIVK